MSIFVFIQRGFESKQRKIKLSAQTKKEKRSSGRDHQLKWKKNRIALDCVWKY